MAFGLASVQSVLDLMGGARAFDAAVIRAFVLGALVGVVGGALCSLLISSATRAAGTAWTLRQSWQILAHSFRPALVYGAMGLGFNLALGWNTALTSAVIGLLWAMPLLAGSLKPAVGNWGRAALIAAPAVIGLIWIWTRFGWF
jgi:hypothetical protein